MGSLDSIGWTAVGTSVAELFSSGVLTLAVAEPRIAAPTAEQQLGDALAACVVCVRSGRQQLHAQRGGVFGPAASGTRIAEVLRNRRRRL